MDYGYVYLENIEFNKVNTAKVSNAFSIKRTSKIEAHNISLKNIFHRGALIKNENDLENILFDNITIENYNSCAYEDELCHKRNNIFIKDSETVLYNAKDGINFEFSNLNINNFNLYTLFLKGKNSNVNINNSNIENGYFMKGAVYYYNTNDYSIGNVMIENSTFNNIYGENGPIVNIDFLAKSTENHIIFKNILFKNVIAYDFGGIIYTLSEDTKKMISFINCKFENVKANFGSICHSFNREAEPYISNKEELINNYGNYAFSTNPVKLEPDKDNIKNLTIYSGDSLSNTLK
eukprot:jgi/Orpsp1_1/1185926/evm.model.c7180000096053.1